MISMNCSPPRAMATASPATFPAVNARMRNRLSWNIGSATLAFDQDERRQQRDAAERAARYTAGLVQPIVCVAVGLDAVGERDQDGAEAERRR